MGMARELKQLQGTWRRSKAKNRLKPVKDGKYTAKIIDARLEKSKNTSRLQVAQVFQIVRGKFKDRMVYRYSGLEDENGISYFKSDLKKLGVKIPKKIVNISRAIEKCIDLTCNITVKTRGEFTNIFIDDLVEEEDEFDEEDDE